MRKRIAIGAVVVVIAAAVLLALRPRMAGDAADGARRTGSTRPGDVVPVASPTAVGAVVARVVRVPDRPAGDVTLLVRGRSAAGSFVSLRAVTSSDGRASIATLPAGSAYTVHVAMPGEPSVERRDVVVRGGQATDLGTLVLDARATVRGRVVDEYDTPIAGADVRAFAGGLETSHTWRLGSRVDRLMHDPRSLASTSDADGRFEFADVPPGTLTLRATTRGRSPGWQRIRGVAPGSLLDVGTITVNHGTVVRGVVVDANGASVAGARVLAVESPGAEDILDTPDPSITDAAGAFEFVVWSFTRLVDVFAEATGFAPSFRLHVDVDRGDVRIVLQRGVALEVVLVDESDGSPIEGVLVHVRTEERKDSGTRTGAVSDVVGIARMRVSAGELWVGAEEASIVDRDDVPTHVRAGTDNRFTIRLPSLREITGRVHSRAGTPVEGALVRFRGSGDPHEVLTDALGRYRASGRATSFFADVLAPGFARDGFSTEFGTDGFTPEIDAGATDSRKFVRDVTLDPSFSLRGRVLDADGASVEGARVEVHERQPSVATTRRDGTFEIHDVGSASSLMVIEAAGHLAHSRWIVDTRSIVRDATGEPEPIANEVDLGDVRLSRGASIRGSLRTADGRPVRGVVTGRLLPYYSSQLPDTRTGPSGTFAIAGLEPGRWALFARSVGFAPSRRTVVLEGAVVVAEVAITMRPRGRLSVGVRDAEGRPVGGAWVTPDLMDSDEDFVMHARATTDADGHVAIDEVPRGPVGITVRARGFFTLRAPVSTEAVGDVRLVRLTPRDARRVDEIEDALADIRAEIGHLVARGAIAVRRSALEVERAHLLGEDRLDATDPSGK